MCNRQLIYGESDLSDCGIEEADVSDFGIHRSTRQMWLYEHFGVVPTQVVSWAVREHQGVGWCRM